MSGKLRYFVAGAMLLLLGLLLVFAPSPEQVFAVQSKKLLEGFLADLDRDLPTQGSRVTLTWATDVPEVPDTVRAHWQRTVEAWAAKSGLVRLAEGGAPLTLRFDPRTDPRRVSLHLAPIRAVDGPEAVEVPDRIALLGDFRSILPPFLTILIAVLLSRTILALVCGVVVGGFLYAHDIMVAAGRADFYRESVAGVEHMATHYLWGNIVRDDFQLKILLFVLLLSMAVGIMAKCGGIDGMVDLVKTYAHSARSSQLVAWIMGLLVFFDDYANTIVVGSTMRPLTDRLRVSREKLAYIVDSTAAPVAGISMLSTWVAYEISTFAPSLTEVTDAAGKSYTATQGFQVFLQTIPYRFYCILTLCMVLLSIVLRREFGPMLRAERRARRWGKLIEDGATPLVSAALTETRVKEGSPARWWNGVLPIVSLLAVTVWQIWETGKKGLPVSDTGFFASVRGVLGQADSTHAIFIGAASAAGLAALLAVGQRILTPLETAGTAVRSLGALFFAVVILVLAWSMGDICKDELGTAYYLVALTEGRLPPLLLPAILFLLACVTAFSIGSSWSTMAILLPNVVLLAHTFGARTDLGGPTLMILSIGAVLEGSIFGDHCSPISDTTVLSSVACASDHMHHVRTQIPYAVLVMVTSMVVGYLPMALVSPRLWPLSLVLGVTGIALFLLYWGEDPEAPEA